MSRPIKWSIPGIKGIGIILAEELPSGCLERFEADLPVLVSADLKEIQFFGTPTCEVEEKHKKSGVEYRAKLKFDSSDRISEPRALAYVVTDNEGKTTMLGQREDPAPRLEVGTSEGEFNGRKGISYEVTCITAPIEVIFAGRILT